jgi:hypothetical protein
MAELPPSTDPGTPRSWVAVVAALIVRCLVEPTLIPKLLLVGWRFRRRRWWARAPFLPIPARDYVRWRMHTAYGRDDAIPPAHELAGYARWVWDMRRVSH